MYKGMEFACLSLSFSFFFLFFFCKYPIEMKLFGLTVTKLFNFHRIFKSRGRGGGGSSEPQDPLWIRHCYILKLWYYQFKLLDMEISKSNLHLQCKLFTLCTVY